MQSTRLLLLPRHLRLAVALSAIGLVLPHAHAQFNQTGAGPFDYNTTVNWTGGTINGVFSQTPSVAQSVTFGGNSTLTTGLTFGLGGSGKSLTLRGDGTERTVTLGGDVSVSGTTSSIVFGSTTAGNGLNFVLGADRTFSVASGNTLYVNNVVSGANALAKTGTGQLTLAGANTYTGTTTVNTGTLFLNASGSLASGNNVVVNSTTAAATATLTLGTGFTQTIGTLTLGGTGSTASSTNVVTLNAGSTLTLGGTVSVDGTGNHTPNWDINGTGTLALGANRTFDVADSTGTVSELNIFTPISGSGLSLTKTGAGRLALNSAGTTYDGGSIVNGGQLWLNASNTLAATGNVTINDTLGGTAAVILAGNATQTIGALTFGGSGGTVTSANNLALGTGSTLTLGGTVTYNGATGPLTSTISGGTLALGGDRTFSVSDSTSTTAELNISSVITGAGNSLTKTGTGRLQLTGANTYDGGTVLNGGVIFAGSSGALGTGPVTINNVIGATSTLGVNTGAGGNTTIGALTFGGAGASTTSQNDVQINTSTLTLGGTVTYDATNNPKGSTISPLGTGALDLGANRTFNIGNSSTTTTELTITAPVTGSGLSLLKIGAGALRLMGANTYSGGTTVSAGGLVVANSTGSGVGSGAVTIQNGAYLRGSGFISGATTIEAGGILGTGTTSGTTGNLTFTNGLTLNDGAVFNFQLGTASDKFTLTGGTLTGASTLGSLTINLTAGAGFGAGVYTLFDFSTGGVTTSSFDVADFALGTTVGGYTYSLASAGSLLQLTAVSAIPEPSTYAAIFGAVSLLGAVVYRRRKNNAHPHGPFSPETSLGTVTATARR